MRQPLPTRFVPATRWLRCTGYTHGDDALVAWVQEHIGGAPAMSLVDAPLVCPNKRGSRPVDRKISSDFWRQHAGCHPANNTKGKRPGCIAEKLEQCGFLLDWDLSASDRLLIEVYPHPATIRLFSLDCIVKYKRPPVSRKRQEFERLQELIGKCLSERFPKFQMAPELDDFLNQNWSKETEDRTDVFLCALIGRWCFA